jgi:transcriptional regulator with XRE-family HTH domain
MSIGEKLTKLLRLYRKGAIASEAGITTATLRTVIQGKHKPSMDTVLGLARVLNVDPGWLIDPTREFPPQQAGARANSKTDRLAAVA